MCHCRAGVDAGQPPCRDAGGVLPLPCPPAAASRGKTQGKEGWQQRRGRAGGCSISSPAMQGPAYQQQPGAWHRAGGGRGAPALSGHSHAWREAIPPPCPANPQASETSWCPSANKLHGSVGSSGAALASDTTGGPSGCLALDATSARELSKEDTLKSSRSQHARTREDLLLASRKAEPQVDGTYRNHLCQPSPPLTQDAFSRGQVQAGEGLDKPRSRRHEDLVTRVPPVPQTQIRDPSSLQGSRVAHIALFL